MIPFGAYTVLSNGAVVRWHRDLLDECTDDVCPLPHASKDELTRDIDRKEGE